MSEPSFASFYEKVHGYPPFPWQQRLAERVVGGSWPALLDLPTGSGKTSAIDIALYALAMKPNAAYRRIFMVVDRRIIVHQASQHARTILAKIAAPDAPIELRRIAEKLRSLFIDPSERVAANGRDTAPAAPPPFTVAELRGGMPRETEWARRPDQPVVGVSTVDQVGSRLLFRGYGVSPGMAPIHAGLLGNDVLYLLDEVHLARPFADTLRVIKTRWQHKGARFAVVRMSATPCEDRHDDRNTSSTTVVPFGLNSLDRENEVLARRLGATKTARCKEVKVVGDEQKRRAKLAKACVEQVEIMLSRGARVIGVVVNRVDTARETQRLLTSGTAKTLRQMEGKAKLLTGRMRSLDRDALMRETHTYASGERSIEQRLMTRTDRDQAPPLVIVSTQCIEAGADYDFDGLVTQCASLDALRQRFGRLDRKGAMKAAEGDGDADTDAEVQRGLAQAVILMRHDQVEPKNPDPVYGVALPNTWKWLLEQGETIDFGIDAIDPQLPHGSALMDYVAPHEQGPALLPATLDVLAQTSPKPVHDPEVARWLHGKENSSPEVSIVWRADVESYFEAQRNPEHADHQLAAQQLKEALLACPPTAIEALSIPVYAAKAWLREATVQPDVNDTYKAAEEKWTQERDNRSTKLAFRWRDKDADFVEPHQLKAGDTLVVPTHYGGLFCNNWDPTAQNNEDPPKDLGDLAQLKARGRAVLRPHAQVLAVWELKGDIPTPPTVPTATDDDSDIDEGDIIAHWLEASNSKKSPAAPTPGPRFSNEWQRLLDTLGTHPQHIALPNGHYALHGGRVKKTDAREQERTSIAATESDDGCFINNPVTLKTHSRDVERWARNFSNNLSLSAELRSDVVLAGWLHDVGKADTRFQRWLNGGFELPAAATRLPLAKSAAGASDRRARELARRRANYPKGYRHELLSLDMLLRTDKALAQAHDRDLVLYLVASHHGYCRPFAPAVDHPDDFRVEYHHHRTGHETMADETITLHGQTRHRLARLDMGVGERFFHLLRKYGWWQLAWLEAILRLADHRASEFPSSEINESEVH